MGLDLSDPSDATGLDSSNPSDVTGLDGLRPGQYAEVASVEAQPPLATRLADLGFCPGTRVQVVRRAPLGDPVLYELRGCQIALRQGEASLIRVRNVTS
ncbi:MAG: ferrous iron transport protein A [Deltaproteobacteria bacterium]|nr:ferrous iron transport protein A [Deltaproteobacteria bacterium]MBW2444557.1 ferrous iron transport protein A [Deltaproteobacteria bacterium]